MPIAELRRSWGTGIVRTARVAADCILQPLGVGRGDMAFTLQGPGGFGKTFLYKALCNLRIDGKNVICMASSGTASLVLLCGGCLHQILPEAHKLSESFDPKIVLAVRMDILIDMISAQEMSRTRKHQQNCRRERLVFVGAQDGRQCEIAERRQTLECPAIGTRLLSVHFPSRQYPPRRKGQPAG